MRLSSLQNNNGWRTTTCWYLHTTETTRGGKHLTWNGYTCRQNNKIETWLSWKCTQRNCKATICTRDDTASKIGQPHNHLPHRAAVEGRRILGTIRNRARDELTHLPSISDEEITKLRDAPWDAQSREFASNLPTFHTDPDRKCYHQFQLQDLKSSWKWNVARPQVESIQAEDWDINKILILFNFREYPSPVQCRQNIL